VAPVRAATPARVWVVQVALMGNSVPVRALGRMEGHLAVQVEVRTGLVQTVLETSLTIRRWETVLKEAQDSAGVHNPSRTVLLENKPDTIDLCQ
jgi:hypothetical protein